MKKLEDFELGEGEDFTAMLEESEKSTETNTVTEGEIVSINDNNFVVSIGGREGQIYTSEITINGKVKYNEGDKITVMVTGTRGENLSLSYKKVLQKEKFDAFVKEHGEEPENVIVEGTVISVKPRAGFVVQDAEGMEYFMPMAQGFLKAVGAVGKKIKAVVLKAKPETSSIVISRRKLIEETQKNREEKILKLMETNEPKTGIIKKITSYGMFVDVGGMDGLVHYSQISHKGPVNPSKYFQEGDEVNVIALDYDKKKRHLSLSIKDANPDPWADIDAIIGVGDTVTATVSNIEPYGVFVDLGEDLEAFLHVSEISWDKNVKHPKDYLENNSEINVEVIEIDKEGRRLRVSLKNLLPKPMDAFTSSNRVGDVVTGTVTSITDFGAFVKVGAIEGLLHNQEISWDKSKNAKSELKVGDEVEVKIIKIDRDAGKISLSKKALEDSPVKAFAETHKNGAIVTGTVKDKKDFGVFIALEDSVDALIRTEDLHPLKIDEIEKGQEIKGVISFIDANTDRIRVSVKRLERQEEREAMDQLNLDQDDSMTLGDAFGDKFKK